MITDKHRIKHILNAISKINEITNCTWDDFFESSLKKDAVLYNFLIIGEAATKLSDETQGKHPEIPWKQIIGMRNIIIHDYVQTDYKLVWQTAKVDLQQLKLQLQILVES